MKSLKDKEFNRLTVETLANSIKKFQPTFDTKTFIKDVFDKNWNSLELKEAMRHITVSMHKHLNLSYKHATEVLCKAAANTTGFIGMCFPNYVEIYGLQASDENISVLALKEMTKYSSSEFAIRPFIARSQEKLLKILLQWSQDKNQHVRRLCSEGCRPRLPWAQQLPNLITDPSPIYPILENLKNDPSEYVRRSIANNLNDITKDHPDAVIKIAKRWYGKNENTNRLVKHALRTLLKKGNSNALNIFGYKNTTFDLNKFVNSKEIKISEKLNFSFQIKPDCKSHFRIEYIIYYLKQNQTHARKVYKLKEVELEIGSHLFTKAHTIKPMTTRKLYEGVHFLAIQINGVESKKKKFVLNSN